MSFYVQSGALGDMSAMGIHAILLIILAPMTRGLLPHHQNCSDYCKSLSNDTRLDCDCSSVYQYKRPPTTRVHGDVPPAKAQDEDIFYDSIKKYSETDIKPNAFFKTKKYHRSIATHGKNRLNNILQNSEHNLHEIITKNEIPLYLDIDLYESTKYKTYHDVLADVFENIRFIEKNLTECLNLHIFVFSKNFDNQGITNTTNWGLNVKQYDKLSYSKVLSEIKNKCNQTNNLVAQSVNDIKNWSATSSHSNYSKEALRNKEAFSRSKLHEQVSEGNIPWVSSIEDTQKTQYDTRNLPKANITYENIIKLKNRGDYTTETQLNNTTKTNNGNPVIDNYFRQGLKNSSDQQRSVILTKLNRTDDAETIKDTTAQTNLKYTDWDYLTKYRRNDIITTTPVDKSTNITINNTTSRAEYQEGEYLIPKVITKELPNDTVQSVVEGYEDIPNSDYIDQSTTPVVLITEQSESVTELYHEQNNYFGKFTTRTVPQVNGVEIEGRLYFLYGKYQIPARFIQEDDGNIHLAIDGYSLCSKILEQKHKSTSMSLLCKCLVLAKCSQI